MNRKILNKLKQIQIDIKTNPEDLLLNNSSKQINLLKKTTNFLALLKRSKKYHQIIEIYNQYKKNKKEILDLIELASHTKDKTLLKAIQLELSNLIKSNFKISNQIKAEVYETSFKELNSAILELRAGTGGNEACIFVEEMFRMYYMYFKEVSWNVKILNSTPSSYKGYKEIIMKIYGKNVYNVLKYESGVHRVQRIPETEGQGRLHTSAITVAVLPEINKTINIYLNPEEIKRESFRSRGAGGQNVNKTETAIRLTHLPTGIISECQEERSQHKNLEKALRVLKDRILNLKRSKQIKKLSTKRKLLISTGDRSVKIRTYNFHKGIVTDHRLKQSFSNLEEFMNGKIEKLINLFQYLNK
ncbi:PCRF domain-containing protein [Candidatus Karelsulcia muelleri]